MVAGYLLDVNVLIALAWPAHMPQGEALTWFPKFSKEAVSPRTALALLERITKLKEQVFWPDALTCQDAMAGAELIAGHQQLTVFYLLGLAWSNNGVLATFDRSVMSAGAFRDRVELI